MSTAARTAMDDHTVFLQSPVYDLYSFYWVALWAALHNVHLDVDKLTEAEKKFRTGLSGTTLERSGASARIGSIVYKLDLPRFNRIQTRSSEVQSYPAVVVVYVRRVARESRCTHGQLA